MRRSLSVSVSGLTWIILRRSMLVGLRSVTGAITRTIPTLARRTDITAQAGSSAVSSPEPAPGITAGTVIPGDGAGVTLVGTDTAAAMDIVADTDIAVAM